MKKIPKVSVIIVNYNGKYFLRECLNSVLDVDFPKSQYEVILVDNDSRDGSIEYVTENFPDVKIVHSKTNLGFADGCNLGVKNSSAEFVVFLNTDTRVDKLWLKSLVRRIQSDKNIAAVNSKVFLYHPFIELSIHSDIFMRSEFSESVNFQSVGVLLESVLIKDKQLQSLIRYRKGFYDKEKGIISSRWTKGDATILIPIYPKKRYTYITLTIRSEKSNTNLKTDVSVWLGDKKLISDQLKSYEINQYKIKLKNSELKNKFLYAVQNTGVIVFKSGYGRDRGALVRDHSQFYVIDNLYYKKAAELNAFAGTSVIIRKKVFEDLGGFDGTYFMYYEDVDLSLRMKRKGWKIVYEPKSKVYHIHAGSSGEWSRLFSYNVEKNYLATLIKHFPWNRILNGFMNYIVLWILSILRMIKWRFREHWELYDAWREKVEDRTNVIFWIFQKLPHFFIKRFKIALTQKKTLSEVYRKLY